MKRKKLWRLFWRVPAVIALVFSGQLYAAVPSNPETNVQSQTPVVNIDAASDTQTNPDITSVPPYGNQEDFLSANTTLSQSQNPMQTNYQVPTSTQPQSASLQLLSPVPSQGWDTNDDGFLDAFDLDNDGKIDAWSSWSVTNNPELRGQINMWDTNKDGKVDQWDSNGDGFADIFDTDFDEQIDAWSSRADGKINMWDRDGDSKADAFDTNNDGFADHFDLNGDGNIDAWSSWSETDHPELRGQINKLDTDKDGAIDAFDTDGDGKMDSWRSSRYSSIDMWDKDRDGLADTFTQDYLSRQLREISQGEPFVYFENGVYYLYYSEWDAFGIDRRDKNVVVYTSRDFIHWTIMGRLFTTDGIQSENPFSQIWGPEVLKVGDRYAVIFSASQNNAEQALWIAYSDSPAGPFGMPMLLNSHGTGPRSEIQSYGQQTLPANQNGGEQIMRIDASYFTDSDGRLWMSYVWYDRGNQISIIEMDPNDPSKVKAGSQPMQLIDSRAMLYESGTGRRMPMDLLPDGSSGGIPVAEGPHIVKHGDDYVLFYAANATNLASYSIYYKKAKSISCLSSSPPQGCSVTQGIAYDGLESDYSYSHGQFLNVNGELFHVMLARKDNDSLGRRAILVVKQEFDTDGNPVTAMPRPDSKIYIPPIIDRDHDGRQDAWDTNHNGFADAFDTDGDSVVDAWSSWDPMSRYDLLGQINEWDTNKDGKADKWDSDGDGFADHFDRNYDGTIDAWSSWNAAQNPELRGRINMWDTNKDGKADSFDLNGDGKVDAWSSWSKMNHPKLIGRINMWDTNFDGTKDAFDTDGDGFADHFDLNGDGKMDAWSTWNATNHPELRGKVNMWDKNGDSKPDSFDLNGDGRIDAWSTRADSQINMWDQSGDGRADAFDTDGDGFADHFDLNDDGKMDAWSTWNAANHPELRGKVNMWDSNGDGVADIFDMNGNGTLYRWAGRWVLITAKQRAYLLALKNRQIIWILWSPF